MRNMSHLVVCLLCSLLPMIGCSRSDTGEASKARANAENAEVAQTEAAGAKAVVARLNEPQALANPVATPAKPPKDDVTAAEAQATASPVVKLLSAVDILEKVDGELMRASTVEVSLAPGAAGMPHRHPGAVFGYVVEGELEFKVEGSELQTLKAGDTFYEPAMILHEVSRNSSNRNPTRVVAVVVHPRDAKQLSIPEVPTTTKKSEDDE